MRIPDAKRLGLSDATIGELLAEAIKRIHSEDSVSSLFEM